VKQLVRSGSHAALWVLAMVLLAGMLGAWVGVAAAASPTYTLSGIVSEPGAGAPVPAGVQVDLVSKATGSVCTTPVFGGGGQFAFSSSGSNACAGLQPGYWGVYVPPETNVSICRPFMCAVLPQNSTPVYYYQNASQLSMASYKINVSNVAVLPYNATLKGNVTSGGQVEQGATVALLAPTHNSVILVNNTTNVNGSYTLKVPFGTWVLQTTFNGVPTSYNFTQVMIKSRNPASVNPKLDNFAVSGRVRVASTGAPVPNVGNVTLFDPSTGYIYSAGTSGGYYSIGTYPTGFTGTAQSFDVVLATSGYSTSWYALTGTAGPVNRDVSVSPIAPGQLGVYNTTVDLSKLNLSAGTGNVSVVTAVTLGNDSVVPGLPNGTVGQLWAQLGLDWAQAISFPAADAAKVQAWLATAGPAFPAVQAGLTLNGTGVLSPKVAPTLANFTSSCVGSCSPSIGGGINFGWHSVYGLNGTIPKNSSAYSVSFGFAHPSTAADVYNYSIDLPKGYVLSAGTTAPASTTLVPTGPGGTWTHFTLSSLASSTPAGTATFSVVKAANLTANVNVSVKNFAFSSSNVLNGTHANYTVIVGVGQNVTFSALNSTYPAGTNGTRFVWNFGDGSSPVTASMPTTNHTYTTASGSTPDKGNLTITSSGGLVNSTTFRVWIAATGGVTAKITGNWTNSFSTPGPYSRVNWSTILQLNATGSTAKISPTAPVPSVISVALWTITAKGYKSTTNYSSSTGNARVPLGNLTPQFLGAGNYYTKTALVGGQPVALTGWEYNVSLKVWSVTGQSNTATYTILVNDTEKPSPAFVLQSSAGKSISGGGIQVAKNGTVKVLLNAGNATDPHNGSLVRYYWLLTNPGNSTVHTGANYTAVRPNGSLPGAWLSPQVKPYNVNLTVWDLNGNHAYTNQSLTVSANITFRPLMAANNLTAPATVTAGTSYTIWVNVTVGGGPQAVANNVTVSFYTLSPSGTGSRNLVGGSPGSVQFYQYTGGVLNSTLLATGTLPTLAHNKTVRAQISWNPSSTGNFVLYANVSASNEYAGDYLNGPQTVSQSITVNPNPTTQLLIDVGIAAAAIAAILLIVFFLRRRSRKAASPKSSGRSGLERKSRDEDDEDEDDDEK
jgi:PKD domain